MENNDLFDVSYLNLPEDKENNLLVVNIKDNNFPSEQVCSLAKALHDLTGMKIVPIHRNMFELSVQTKEQIIESIKKL